MRELPVVKLRSLAQAALSSSRSRLLGFAPVALLVACLAAISEASELRAGVVNGPQAPQNPAASSAPTKVAIVLFPGVELLDFAGPAEAFAGASDEKGGRLFEVFTVGSEGKPLKSMRFLTITPTYAFENAPTPDIVVLPGGNVYSLTADKKGMEWVAQQSKRPETLMFSVCNGATILAKLGLLENLKISTHHLNFEIIKRASPSTVCLPDRRFVDNGRIVTAAGVSAGIDGALHVIAKTKGEQAARRTATYIEYDYYVGFDEAGKARILTDEKGVISLRGREHRKDP